jgi:dTDP-4-amino-4,6-dideoxygalactose transaminase
MDPEALGVPRELFLRALEAEGVPVYGGYVRPLYLQPLYQKRAAGCSFNCPKYTGSVSYDKGLCPVAEKMHFEELITHEFMRPGMQKHDLDDVVRAFEKVAENAQELSAN